MCLEGRARALLLACWPVVVGACGAGHPAPSARPGQETPGAQSQPAPGRDPAAAREATPGATGARVSGKLSTPDRRPLVNGALVMTPEENDGSAAAVDATVLPDGSFLFENVQPGTYQIRALAHTDRGGPLFALYRVAVRGPDVGSLDLALRPAATISGTLHADASRRSRPVLSGARVMAPFADGSRFGEALTGDVLADGSFTISGVMAGTHVIVVEALPEPWVVQRVLYRGQDITDTGIQAEVALRLHDVDITVTDAASEVSGTVRDANGRAAADALVLIVPQQPGLWPLASRRFGRLRVAADGAYRLRGLPSGDYRLAAFGDLDERAAYRPDTLRAVRERGTPVSVEDSATRTIDLSLMSSPR